MAPKRKNKSTKLVGKNVAESELDVESIQAECDPNDFSLQVITLLNMKKLM